QLALSDVVVQRGAFQPLPAGATPYSLNGLVKVDKPNLSLKPGQDQTVTLVVSGRQPERLHAGLLTATPTMVNSTSGGGFFLRPQPSISVPLVVSPVDSNGKLTSALRAQAGGLRVPRILESGPLIVAAEVKNSGDTFGRAQTTFKFSTPFSRGPFLVRQSA